MDEADVIKKCITFDEHRKQMFLNDTVNDIITLVQQPLYLNNMSTASEYSEF